MASIKLNKTESKELAESGSVIIIRGGFEVLIEQKWDNANINYDDLGNFEITVVNPYDVVKFAKDF